LINLWICAHFSLGDGKLDAQKRGETNTLNF